MDANKETPVLETADFPKIRIGDREYEVYFRCGDVIRLRKDHKIDIFKRGLSIEEGGVGQLQGIDAMEHSFLMLSYGLSHAQDFTPDQLANLCGFDRVMEVAAVVNDALGKAFAQANETARRLNQKPEKVKA